MAASPIYQRDRGFHLVLLPGMGQWRSSAIYSYFAGWTDIPIGMLEARIYLHTVDIGYVLARKNWGIGLMPEAVAAFTELALAQLACFRVQATCDIENNASARTLEKAGFMREAVLQRYTVHPNISSVSRPCFMYARCK
ncbi:GNAT family N-acetyltransferase [Betaproteobacteria bacterium PRO5]|nr:GNAT family N-acetyltransferase [Betaproteobacteria bacterium PRO5]